MPTGDVASRLQAACSYSANEDACTHVARCLASARVEQGRHHAEQAHDPQNTVQPRHAARTTTRTVRVVRFAVTGHAAHGRFSDFGALRATNGRHGAR